MTGQIKSKQRVADHGEVFTAEREVKAMCDLVKQETERIESRFLEPACGTGNFLFEILFRKLTVVKNRYGKSPTDYEKYSVLAVSSIYGVELLPDNVAECRTRLFTLWDEAYTTNNRQPADDQCREAVWFILKKNILCGNVLTLRQADGSPIIFAEWNLVSGTQIKRRDFALNELLNGQDEQMDSAYRKHDEEMQAFTPTPVRVYPLTDYRNVQNYK